MPSQRTYIFVGRPGGSEQLITNINEAFIYLRSSLAKAKPFLEFDIDDYANQLIALLPRGAAWDNADQGVFGALIYAIAAEFARVSDQICVLENETFPLNTTMLLTDWERVLDLPAQSLADYPQSQGERRGALVTKLATLPSPTPGFFAQLAQDFGYAVDVIEYFPARVGYARIGDVINAPGNEFLWSVRIPGSYTQSRRAQVGDTLIGDRIATWGNGALELLLTQYKPAHTTLSFLYA